MATKFDARQTISRDLLSRIATAAGTSLDSLLRALNSEATPPFALSATSSPSLVVNVGSAKVSNPNTGITRTVAAIGSDTPDFTSGTITLPATSGGNIVLNPGSPVVLTLPVGQFIKGTIYLDATNNLNILLGTPGATEDDANALPAPDSTLAIGYITIQNLGGTIQPIQNSAIYQFVGVGGAGGSGNANELIERVKDYFQESPYEFATPIIFANDKETLTDAATTGAYSVINKTYVLDAGETFVSKQLADPDYLDQERSVSVVDLIAYWRFANIDTAATYEVSLNGGSSWTAITMNQVGGTDTFRGQLEFPTNTLTTTQDIRVRVTSSGAGKELAGIAIFYGVTGPVLTGIDPVERFVFSGNINQTTFPITKFKPDVNFLKAYDENTGKVYVNGAFTISGTSVVFPSGTFLSPGETIALRFEQLMGGSFDASPANANLLAENRLGSADPTADRSAPGEGILLRSTNGDLCEVWLEWNGITHDLKISKVN